VVALVKEMFGLFGSNLLFSLIEEYQPASLFLKKNNGALCFRACQLL
jgi:hypothetical protein